MRKSTDRELSKLFIIKNYIFILSYLPMEFDKGIYFSDDEGPTFAVGSFEKHWRHCFLTLPANIL